LILAWVAKGPRSERGVTGGEQGSSTRGAREQSIDINTLVDLLNDGSCLESKKGSCRVWFLQTVGTYG